MDATFRVNDRQLKRDSEVVSKKPAYGSRMKRFDSLSSEELGLLLGGRGNVPFINQVVNF